MFGCLNRCVSPPGRRLLRLLFSRPIVNLEVLSDRLDGIHFFMQRPDALKALRWEAEGELHWRRAASGGWRRHRKGSRHGGGSAAVSEWLVFGLAGWLGRLRGRAIVHSACASLNCLSNDHSLCCPPLSLLPLLSGTCCAK